MGLESESEVAQSCPTMTPWTVAYQAPPPMGFARQEYWSGVPLPSPMGLEETSNNLEYWTFFSVHFLLFNDCEVVQAQTEAFL